MSVNYRTQQNVAVDSSTIADSDVINFDGMEYGIIHEPTGSSITALTFYVIDPSGNAVPLYDGATAVTIASPQAGRSYPIPSQCRGAKKLKILGAGGDGVVDVEMWGP